MVNEDKRQGVTYSLPSNDEGIALSGSGLPAMIARYFESNVQVCRTVE
jgi:hypothetical protein